MPIDTASELRTVNVHLRATLNRMRPELGAPWLLKANDLSDLRGVILRAAKCRRAIEANGMPDAEAAKELSEYRSNMEELARVLPNVQGRLLAEKARLQNGRAHLAAIESWAQASQGTL